VDFAERGARLEAIATRIATGDLRGLAGELIERLTDGGIKLYVIHRALGARRAAPALYRQGRYVPLAVAGPAESSVCAFARRHGTDVAIVIVPRLVAHLTGKGARLPLGLETWGDTRVLLPAEAGTGPFIDRFTGVAHQAAIRDGQAVLAVGEVLADVPVALLASGLAAGPDVPEGGP
jgi:(1->4)-alpha-D-glucan 1-alpha-D-glucosylmutase